MVACCGSSVPPERLLWPRCGRQSPWNSGWTWHRRRPEMRPLPGMPTGITNAGTCLPRATQAYAPASRLLPALARPVVCVSDRTLAGYPVGPGLDISDIHPGRHPQSSCGPIG